jgi:glycosyltransferase involved in cell wall biosynthesis
MQYVLITPVRNEESFIHKTLESVTSQTQPPVRWVIVNDGSSDHTPQIAEEYAADFQWIEIVHRPQNQPRSFAGKVHAFNAGYEKVRSLDFEILGNLDGDLSFERDYLGFLVKKFVEDPQLGVAGTPFIENGYDSAKDSFEGKNHVAGGCQMFRRRCFEEIGGYTPNPAGGIDWIAVTTARMKGWKTCSFLDKRFHHHRHLGTAERGVLPALFLYGQKDYYLGNSPIWQVFRLVYTTFKRPLFIGAFSLACGYFSAALRRMPRAVDPELMRFHRAEQMRKLKAIFSSLLRLKKVDSFVVAAEQE